MARRNLFIPLGAACVVALLALGTGTPAYAQSGQGALNDEMRITTLEDQMRTLNGRIEELNNTVSQLKDQLERAQSDNDVRFRQLQQGGGQPQPGPDNGPGAGSPPPQQQQGALDYTQPPQPKPSQSASDMSQPPSRSGNLGTLPGGAPQQPQQQQAAAAGGGLPPGNSQDQYNYAMGLLTQANYPAAEQAMRAFVQRYPKDPLAGNAQYWLGETYYVRKDYQNAATAFAQGYEKYPKGSKAADDLLKLGMSLTALKQKPDACKVYGRLEHDFAPVPQSIKDRLATERHNAGC